MTEVTGQQTFDDLSQRIKNVASKMDIILFGLPGKHKELIEDVFVLQCFYLAVYRQPSEILSRFIERLEAQAEQSKEQKKKRKDTGSYFTPPYIAEYIVQATIGPLVEKLYKGRKPKKAQTKIKRLLSLRICDPAVGGGIFLVCAHDFLMQKILEADPNADLDKVSRDSAHCLFGVDINPDAVEGCKLALHLNIAKWSLKKQILEFANTVRESSSSLNDSSDNNEKPSTAQGLVQEKTSTEKTTQTSETKRTAKYVVWPFAWRSGIRQRDSAQLDVPLAPGLETHGSLIIKRKKSLSEWLVIRRITSGFNRKRRRSAQSMASIGETCFKTFCSLLLKVKHQNLSTCSIQPLGLNTSGASQEATTLWKFSAVMSCLKRSATIVGVWMHSSWPNTWRILGELPQTRNISSRVCTLLGLIRAKSSIMWEESGAGNLSLYGSVSVLKVGLRTCEGA